MQQNAEIADTKIGEVYTVHDIKIILTGVCERNG